MSQQCPTGYLLWLQMVTGSQRLYRVCAQPVRNNARNHPICRTAHIQLHRRTSAYSVVHTALDYDEVGYIALTPLGATKYGKTVQDLSQRHKNIQLQQLQMPLS